MTLFERVFGGNDAVYGLTEAAIDNAIAQYGDCLLYTSDAADE